MTTKDLEQRFTQINGGFSSSVMDYLEGCHCDDMTRNALEAVIRETHYALSKTQSAILEYLKSN